MLGDILLVFVLVSVGLFTDDRTIGAWSPGGRILVPRAGGAVRALRSHARLGNEGLVYVGYVRAHRLRWDQVSSFEIRTLDASGSLESVGVTVHLHGGGAGLASLPGVAVFGRVKRLDRLIREYEQRRDASI